MSCVKPARAKEIVVKQEKDLSQGLKGTKLAWTRDRKDGTGCKALALNLSSPSLISDTVSGH